MTMRYRLTYCFSVALAIFAAASCNKLTQGTEPQTKLSPEEVEGVVDGQLLIRFDASVAGIIEQSGLTKSGPQRSLKASGVASVDEVLSTLKGCTIERVFPVDSRSEASARKEGLHLWYLVSFDENADRRDLAGKLSRLGEIDRIEYNRRLKRADTGKATPFEPGLNPVRKATAAPFNDELLPYQWNLINKGTLGASKFLAGADVNVEKAWELSTGEPSIIVAVLDEGVDYSHPDLAANMWINEDEIWRSHEDNDGNGYEGDYYGYNFARGSGVIATDNIYDTGHGTHVAGVIGAVNNNGTGISSIAGGGAKGSGVKIMSCQIFSGNYAGTVLDEVRAIKYAADNGAVILQCSWGYVSGAANSYEWTPQYADDESWLKDNILESKALDYFIHNAGSPDGVIEGGIAVFAGGNEDAPMAGYPGKYGDFVSVAATAADFTPSTYTNYGPGTTICAPGGDQDYYFEYGEGEHRGELGCILSTLPKHISPSGYGYMEGTSMACPHVSGVIALGLSYAAALRRHVKAEEVIELLYSTCLPVEQFWEGEEKYFCKYVSDLGENHYNSINLTEYKGKMGYGQADSYAFLKAIEGAGAEMSFPNVMVAEGGEAVYAPSLYFKGGESLNYSVSVDIASVASAEIKGNRLTIKGLSKGQTKARITADNGKSFDFVITVKDGSSSWL